ncbi:MAG: TIR domain-containing protein, partial [Chitinophagales bacterium]|nr:TIR domain-containing protein [Chitinophagales bacterium]
MSSVKPEIYISYAWKDRDQEDADSREAIVNELEKELLAKGYAVMRDKSVMTYKKNVDEFMRNMGKSRYVIAVISNKYLQSEYCMYEAMRLLRNEDFADRIFPVILSDANIFIKKDRIKYTHHWQTTKNDYEKEVKAITDETAKEKPVADLRFYNEVYTNMAEFIESIAEMCQIATPDETIQNRFNEIISEIERHRGINEEKIRTDYQKLGNNQETPPGVPINTAGPEKNDFGKTKLVSSSTEKKDIQLNMKDIEISMKDFDNLKKQYVEKYIKDLFTVDILNDETLKYIHDQQYRKNRNDFSSRALIVSALTLSIIQKYDAEKLMVLFDFVFDAEPGIWKRALTGVFLGLIGREQEIDDDIERKLRRLLKDAEAQQCLYLLMHNLINHQNIETIYTSNIYLQKIDFSKIDFFMIYRIAAFRKVIRILF